MMLTSSLLMIGGFLMILEPLFECVQERQPPWGFRRARKIGRQLAKTYLPTHPNPELEELVHKLDTVQ